MKAKIPLLFPLLVAVLALLSGCASFWANREPTRSPPPEKITSDINMDRANPR